MTNIATTLARPGALDCATAQVPPGGYGASSAVAGCPSRNSAAGARVSAAAFSPCARWDEIEEAHLATLWCEGWDTDIIGACLGRSATAVVMHVTRMRARGYALPKWATGRGAKIKRAAGR